MTRLTSAQQRATRRAVEQAWQNRYVNRRRARKVLGEVDDSVRHPARIGSEGHRNVAAFFGTELGDQLWLSGSPAQQLMHHGEPSPQGVQHIAWGSPAPRNLAATEGYDDVVREALRQIEADEKAWELEEQSRARRRQIIWWCVWAPVLVLWIGVLVRAVGEQ